MQLLSICLIVDAAVSVVNLSVAVVLVVVDVAVVLVVTVAVVSALNLLFGDVW